MGTIHKLNGDSAADTIWSEVDSLAQDLARFADMVGNGKLVMLECQHIKAHCSGIREFNANHRRGYDPEHDDNILVLVDRCGKIVNSVEFSPSVAPWFLRDMRLCVTQMRDNVARRLMSYYRQQQPQAQAAEVRRANAA